MSDTDMTPWQKASAQLNEAWAAIREAVDTLPTVGDDGKCTSCGSDDGWETQEEGYVRGWRTTPPDPDDDNPAWVAHSSGTEDWSDEGDGATVLVCTDYHRNADGTLAHDSDGRVMYCGTPHQIPDRFEWD